MCEIPTTLKDAKADIIALEKSYRRHEKAMNNAKAALDAAKALILNACPPAEPEEAFDVAVPGGIVSFSKARSTLVLPDTQAVARELEEFKPGLAYELAKFSVTDLRKYIAPARLEAMGHIEYGARTVKVKAD